MNLFELKLQTKNPFVSMRKKNLIPYIKFGKNDLYTLRLVVKLI